MNKETNTLVILTPGFPNSEADTNCLPMQQGFVRTLKENYPKLNIIILGFQYPYFKKKYNWHGTTVISFNGQNKGGLARLLLREKVYAALKKINNTSKIIGILSFWYNECSWVGKKFADRNNLRHYCWLLGQDAKKGNKYIKYLGLKAGELIALSDFLQDEFEKNHGVRPLHLIPSGTDTKRLNNSVKEREIDILGVGSLIPLKQYEILIAVVAEIKKQQPAIKVVLAGTGPEKEKLNGLILKNGLAQNITLAGELPHIGVLELMQRTKVFLHPSSYEGFSGVCQEALAAGANVISFCKAMKQEIEQWHIVKSKEEMIQKTAALLQDRGLAYKIVIPFPVDDTVKKMMSLLAE